MIFPCQPGKFPALGRSVFIRSDHLGSCFLNIPGNQRATLWNIFYSILVCLNKRLGENSPRGGMIHHSFMIGCVSGVNGANQIASSHM